MYRCQACDTPPEMGHSQDCLLLPCETENEQDERINIASGEDVQLEEFA